jgi:hypothetical protein
LAREGTIVWNLFVDLQRVAGLSTSSPPSQNREIATKDRFLKLHIVVIYTPFRRLSMASTWYYKGYQPISLLMGLLGLWLWCVCKVEMI